MEILYCSCKLTRVIILQGVYFYHIGDERNGDPRLTAWNKLVIEYQVGSDAPSHDTFAKTHSQNTAVEQQNAVDLARWMAAAAGG